MLLYEFYCSHLIQVYIKASEFDTRAFKDSAHDKCSYWTLTSDVTPFYPWAIIGLLPWGSNFLCVTEFSKVKLLWEHFHG